MAASRPPPPVQPARVVVWLPSPTAVRIDVAEGRAAGDVGHEAAEGIAETAPRGRQPRIAGFARCTETGAAAGAAADIAPVAVTLEAEHGLAHLVIITDGAADDGAGEVVAVRSERVAPIRMAKAAAAVDADIEAGPVVRRLIHRRLSRHGLPARHVRGARRPRHRHHGERTKARQNQTLHHQTSVTVAPTIEVA